MARIKRITVDLTREGKYDRNRDAQLTADFILQSKLQTHELFGETFLYSVVDANRFKELAKRGTYLEGEIIFAYNNRQLGFTDARIKPNLNASLRQYSSPGIAVYKASHLRIPNKATEYEYRFIDPTQKRAALEALVKIKLKQA